MEDAQIYGHSICDNNNGEEDHIELEVIGSSNSTISLFHFKKISPPPQHEVARSSKFEFQMLSNFIDRNKAADELFYNGKLLPLDHISLHNNPITNKFLHVGKNIVEFEQSFSTPYLQSCNLSQENYFFKYSTNDESSRKTNVLHVAKKVVDFDQSLDTFFFQSCHVSRKLNQENYSTKDESSKTTKILHVGKKNDFLEQSFSTPFCQSCHASRKLDQEDYSTKDESSKTSKVLHVAKKIDDFDQSLDTPYCQSCHIRRELMNQEEYYSTNDESSKLFHVSKSFDDFDQSLNTPFCQSCHVSRKLNNQEEYSCSTDDDQSSSKTSKILHVSKSFDDSKQSFSIPFFQSCHVSGELNNQEDYFFSTDSESSRKSKWPEVSLTRTLRLIKQLSFDHSKIKCLIYNSVKLVAKKDFFGKIHHKKSSFSGAIKKLLTKNSCSSKNSTHGNIQEMHLLVRNKDHDVYTEVDPIQAAIAHCKNSHQVQKKFNSRKSNVSDTIGLGRSLSASRIIFEEQERIDLCRG
ncbi:hypothetical protein R3W88_011072 [Solanum pinnatisectum]|uniref:Uncharacterized protein n=1 Tax=Solanum pinnatisectum TaxID=50273 RepID=A0AAV9L648_9SOLN|nr:hypothetical protein R3W88_011072 [Solanum pinnatisectum]